MYEIVDGALVERQVELVDIEAPVPPRSRRVIRKRRLDLSFYAFHISQGYRVMYQPDHPLARTAGPVFHHRVVLYEAIGPGWHGCTHCGTDVSWDYQYPHHPAALVVDHLDWNRSNNNIANLVVSCGPCNVKRRKPRE